MADKKNHDTRRKSTVTGKHRQEEAEARNRKKNVMPEHTD